MLLLKQQIKSLSTLWFFLSFFPRVCLRKEYANWIYCCFPLPFSLHTSAILLFSRSLPSNFFEAYITGCALCSMISQWFHIFMCVMLCICQFLVHISITPPNTTNYTLCVCVPFLFKILCLIAITSDMNRPRLLSISRKQHIDILTEHFILPLFLFRASVNASMKCADTWNKYNGLRFGGDYTYGKGKPKSYMHNNASCGNAQCVAHTHTWRK